jgi:hypothetical protein
LAELAFERLAARIFENQHGSSAVADELKGQHGPCTVQLVPQFVFVSETIEGSRCWIFNGGEHGQHTGEITVGVTLRSTEDAFAVLPQDMKIAIRICAKQARGFQLPHPSSSGALLAGREKVHDIHSPQFMERLLLFAQAPCMLIY